MSEQKADVALGALCLDSDVAQLQGNEILKRWRELVAELVEQDNPTDDNVTFGRSDHSWVLQPLAA